MPNQGNPKFIIFLDISDLIVNNYDLLLRVIENWGIIVAGNGYDLGDYEGLSVADPGFSPGGAANSQKCYYFSIFCRKLHENERIWDPRGGGGASLAPPLDPPMTMVVITNLISTVWPRSASSNRNFYHSWATSLWNRTEILIMSIDRRSPPHVSVTECLLNIHQTWAYYETKAGSLLRNPKYDEIGQIIYTKWGYDIVVFHEDENPLFPICSFSVGVLHFV